MHKDMAGAFAERGLTVTLQLDYSIFDSDGTRFTDLLAETASQSA